MKNELQNLTEDISRLYEEITHKADALGQIGAIARLYDQLQSQLQDVSAEEIDQLQNHIKTTLEQIMDISQSLAVIKTLKMALNGQDQSVNPTKKSQISLQGRRAPDES